MVKETARNVIFALGLFVGAATLGYGASSMMGPRGTLGPLVLASEHLVPALLALAVTLAVAVAASVVVARVVNPAVAFFALGGSLYGLAYRLGALDSLAFDSVLADAAGSVAGPGLGLMVTETVFWAILAAICSAVIYRSSGGLPDVEPKDDGSRPSAWLSSDALRIVLAGLVAPVAVWFLAQSSLKGQAVGSVFAGAVVAGIIARLLAPHVQPAAVAVGVVLAGAAAQFVGIRMLGSMPLADAFARGAVPRLLIPMPVDWAAGAFMGTAVGLGWAKSFLHHEDDARSAQTATAPEATSG